MMNKSVGNMYPWTTHTINFIQGKCSHQCHYCYYQANLRFKSTIGKLKLNEKALEEDLGEGNTIFVGSSTDMFAEEVPDEWIEKTLHHCRKFKNKYLFQTKNPHKFYKFRTLFPKETLLGITLESNRHYPEVTKAPKPRSRVFAFAQLDFPKMISIEPILWFDREVMVSWIKQLKPEFVSIGADSKAHNLYEPTKDDILELVEDIEKCTKVKIKDNLKRLIE